MTQSMSDVSTGDGSLGTEITNEEVESDSLPEQTPDGDDEEPEGIPLDQIFGILKNQRRRYVLEYLYDAEGQVSLSDVAEQIAAWENEKDVKQISSSERKRVYVGLYQCHLPKMDGAEVVSFNKPRGIIELGENADDLYKYIDTEDDEEDRPWHVYSLTLSLTGAFVLGGALLLRPATTLPVVDIAVVFFVVAFLAYSLVNFHWMRENEADSEDE